MGRYIRIYIRLLQLNFANLVAYRVNFINSFLASVGWGLFSLYSVYILTARMNSAYGFSRPEILLFNGLYGVIVGVFHLLISVNMQRFSKVIHQGDLDLILIKPIDSQFALSFWLVNYTIIIRIIMAIGYTAWFIQILAIKVTWLQVLGVMVISLFSLSLLYSIWFSVLSILIWDSSLSNLVLLMYTLESFARFPREVSQQLINVLFLLIFPITLVINTPTRLLLGKLTLWEICSLFGLAVLALWLSRKIWRLALRNYTSASS